MRASKKKKKKKNLVNHLPNILLTLRVAEHVLVGAVHVQPGVSTPEQNQAMARRNSSVGTLHLLEGIRNLSLMLAMMNFVPSAGSLPWMDAFPISSAGKELLLLPHKPAWG